MTGPSSEISLKSPTLHATILFTIGVFAAIVALSFIFKVEVVAQGQGKIVPVARVQSVQPEFPGKVAEIHVTNGDEVQKGDVLMEFDATEARTELATLEAETARLRLERLRIDVLSGGLDAGDLRADDLPARLVEDLRNRGIELPMLLRVSDVLEQRVKALAGTFEMTAVRPPGSEAWLPLGLHQD